MLVQNGIGAKNLAIEVIINATIPHRTTIPISKDGRALTFRELLPEVDRAKKRVFQEYTRRALFALQSPLIPMTADVMGYDVDKYLDELMDTIETNYKRAIGLLIFKKNNLKQRIRMQYAEREP
jgi:hypothetical protein